MCCWPLFTRLGETMSLPGCFVLKNSLFSANYIVLLKFLTENSNLATCRGVSIPTRTGQLRLPMSYLLCGRLRLGNWRKDFERAWRKCKTARASLDAEALETVRKDVLHHIEVWVAKDPDEGRLACRTEVMDSMERICLRRALT